MSCYFRSTLREFLRTPRSEILAQLTLRYSADGFSELRTDTPLIWWSDLDDLQTALSTVCQEKAEAFSWTILLEFSVPRKLNRIDVVLIAGERIVLLECKAIHIDSAARKQAETYALLLHYFHQPSSNRHIVPIIVSSTPVPAAVLLRAQDRQKQTELGFSTLPSFWIAPLQVCSWRQLPGILRNLPTALNSIIDGEIWDGGAYHPVPTIIEAACALRAGLNIREIATCEAAEHDIALVTQEIHDLADAAKQSHSHVICFLTGVPGSGKTLVGLSLAHLSAERRDAIHFMSGNGPLVSVLQEVFRRQAMRDGVPSAEARIQAQTLIENVHVFAKNYTERDPDRPPSNHVIIFDEAQRAWNLAQNLSKFKRNYSEPDMLLRIMERHQDWACVVALVGGGQEINSGEAGLGEWGRAILASSVNWSVYASPEVLTGGTSTAGQRLFDQTTSDVRVNTRDLLHLRTSNRSLRAEDLASWVNLVLDGKANEAGGLRISKRFPVFLTRELDTARSKLRENALGDSRFGLVGSSKALRLRADGLEPDSSFHGAYPWHHWYLAPDSDIRASFACEVFATEFEVQGLELDWVGVCWGGDFVRGPSGWQARKLWQAGTPKWVGIKSDVEREYRRNAYRVLLTRSRQGMVIFVPKGSQRDATRRPEEMNATAAYLLECGAISVDSD